MLKSFKPRGARVLVRRYPRIARVGGVILPEGASNAQGINPTLAVVVHGGEGYTIPTTGERRAPMYLPGDVVVLPRWAGVMLMLPGPDGSPAEHLVVGEADVQGHAEPGDDAPSLAVTN